jgi:hypothetical protein
MTADWTAGYVADIGYTYGYYNELNPIRVRLALLNAGLALPKQGTACELGFGQGLSVNVHAAASATNWYGTDFNPAQAGFAQELAVASGANAMLYDEAFAEFCSRPDLPDFDYIGLHGIWSWISDSNRAVITDFVRRKLKVGGVLYISYNTMPGWATFAPMRHLMTVHADLFGSDARGIVSKIDGAIEFAEKLLSVNPAFAKANPLVADRLQKMKAHSRSYLAHEYFNRDWYPMHFATMAGMLESAKLQYACSAHYLDSVDAVNFTAEQQALLNEVPHGTFRESVRDFIVNQQFRRDLWVKGARRIGAVEQAEALRKERVVLVSARQDVSLKINSTLGEISMTEGVYNPILDLLSDHKVRTLAQIEQAVKERGIAFGQIVQAVLVLTGTNHLSAAQDEAVIAKSKKHTDRLNAHVISKSRSSNELLHLASPVTGGGLAVSRFQQLFMNAIAQGKKTPQEWANFAWQILDAQGQRIIKDGKTVDSPQENLSELEAHAQSFADVRLPMLKALHVI